MNRPAETYCRTRTALLGILLLLGAELLTACAPLLVGAGFITAINVVTERRTLSRVFDDNTLERQVQSVIKADPDLNASNVDVKAINGIVLLTGEVASDLLRQRAQKLAEENQKTLTVVNELQLSGTTSLTSRANDVLITTKVKAKLLAAKEVPPNVIKVVTEGGKVYLMGLVTEAEAEAAVKATRQVSGVTHIVKVFEFIKDP